MQLTGLKIDVSASMVEQSVDSSQPAGRAAKTQQELFMSAAKALTETPSFTRRSYPCWVVSLTHLRDFDEFPQHEDVIDKLEELLPDSTSPSCAYSFFVR